MNKSDDKLTIEEIQCLIWYGMPGGLALGCDKAAHEGCLSVDGETIAAEASAKNANWSNHGSLQRGNPVKKFAGSL